MTGSHFLKLMNMNEQAIEVANKCKQLAWEADLHFNSSPSEEVREGRKKLLELDLYCDEIIKGNK